MYIYIYIYIYICIYIHTYIVFIQYILRIIFQPSECVITNTISLGNKFNIYNFIYFYIIIRYLNFVEYKSRKYRKPYGVLYSSCM